MSDWIEEVGHATGRQTAELVTNPRDNDFLLQINKKPKVGDKSFPDHNLGAHVFETRRRPVNEAIAENGSEEPSTRRSSLRELPGFTVTGRVVIPAEEPRFANTDVAPPVEPDPFAKGLGDPSAVELINQELQLAQAAEWVIPLPAGGAEAAGGAGAGAGPLAGLLKFLSGASLFFVNMESGDAPTLDDPRVQEMLRQAQQEAGLLSGFDIRANAEGFLQLYSELTGEPVIGADGRILNQQMLQGLFTGFHQAQPDQHAAFRVPVGEGSPIFALPNSNLGNPATDAEFNEIFRAVREFNLGAMLEDLTVVVPLVVRHDDGSRDETLYSVRGSFSALLFQITALYDEGLIPSHLTDPVRALTTSLGERAGEALFTYRENAAIASYDANELQMFGRRMQRVPWGELDGTNVWEFGQARNNAAQNPNALEVFVPIVVQTGETLLDRFGVPASEAANSLVVRLQGTRDELAAMLQTLANAGRFPAEFLAGIGHSLEQILVSQRVNQNHGRLIEGESHIVVGEGSGALPAPDQLTPEEQQRLGLPGSTPTGADPAEMPQHEGFPDQPVDELDGSSPEAEIPQEGIPGGETTPSGGNDGEDLGLERTSFPDLGEEVRITSIHEIPDAHLGVRLDQITEPLLGRANPPLEPAERLALAMVVLGGKLDTEDGRQHWRVAATKLGIEWNIPDGRRELLAMIGAGSSDEVRRLMLGDEAADLLNRYSEITTALLRNPQTFQSLSTHFDALQVFTYLLSEIDALGPSGIVIPEPVDVVNIVLPPELYAISAQAREAAPLSSNEVRQPGFDPSLIGNPDETSLFVNRLYADSAAAMPVLRDVMQGIGDLLEVEVVVREGAKSRARVFEKIEKYGGDPARLTDLTAGRFIADDLNQVYAVLESLQEADNIRILSVDDRIIRPQPSGYRDITMQVEITLPDGGTHIGEIQIKLGELYDFAGMTEHALYEVIRSVSKIGEGASLAAQVLVQQLRNYSRTEYNELIEAELDYIRNESSE